MLDEAIVEQSNDGTPEIFISYAWGDDSSEEGRRRTEVVARLCETLDKEGWNIIRDTNAIQYGDLVSAFQDMKKWYLDVGNMLAHVNGILHPHGFDDIVKNDFAALHQMLQQHC